MISRRTPFWLSLLGLTLLVGGAVPGCNSGGAVADGPPISGDEGGSGGEGGGGQMEAGVDGSVDTSCVDMHMLEARPVQPSAVGLFVSVDNCKGEPVTNLDPKRFVIQEDGQTKSIEASVTPIPLKGQEIFVDLLIDMSTSTAAYRTQLFDAAKQFVDSVSMSGANVQIGIYAFAGDAAPQEWLAPNLDAATVKTKIASLGAYAPMDANSTNLYGAIGQTVQQLESSADAFRRRNFGGAFTADYLIVFTAGRDTSKRATLKDTVTAIQKTPATILGIAVQGPDYDADAATAFAQLASGGVVATDQSSLSTTFAQLATRMEGQFKRTYLIGYCSPARATRPKVTVSLAAPTVTRTAATAEFNAAGFGPGCTAGVFTSCGTKTCGGLGCGACDDRAAHCNQVTGLCSNFCKDQRKCDGSMITNAQGYEQSCVSGPTNLSCSGQCVDSTNDSKNCGACAHDCASTVSTSAICSGSPATCGCPEGPCPVALAPLTSIQNIALDASNAYCATGNGGITKVPLGGGAPVVLTTLSAYDIAVNATTIYWTNGNTIEQMPIGGGTPTVFAAGQYGASRIAIDGASVYWSIYSGGDADSIMKAPLAGGAPVTLASGLTSVSDLAVDATNVYWMAGQAVMKAPLAGGTPVTLAQSSTYLALGRLAVAGGNVYFTTGGSLEKVPVGGGMPVTLTSVDTSKSRIGFLTIDATSVYWTAAYSGADGTVMKMALSGGAPVTLAARQNLPGPVAVDSASIYWATADGVQKRTPK